MALEHISFTVTFDIGRIIALCAIVVNEIVCLLLEQVVKLSQTGSFTFFFMLILLVFEFDEL